MCVCTGEEEKSPSVYGLGFVPSSLQSSLQSSVEAAHEAIHVIERKGMSYGPQDPKAAAEALGLGGAGSVWGRTKAVKLEVQTTTGIKQRQDSTQR